MNYNDLQQFIAAEHLYAAVTDAEHAQMSVDHYMTVLDGVRYIGTDAPVDFLADKELVKPEQEETPANDSAE